MERGQTSLRTPGILMGVGDGTGHVSAHAEPGGELFSSRSQAIEVATDRLIDQFVAEHGRRPSATTILKLRAQAMLATRPDKTLLPPSRRHCD